MGVYAGAQEILACADHIRNVVAWRTSCARAGFCDCAIYLHAVLRSRRSRSHNAGEQPLFDSASRWRRCGPRLSDLPESVFFAGRLIHTVCLHNSLQHTAAHSSTLQPTGLRRAAVLETQLPGLRVRVRNGTKGVAASVSYVESHNIEVCLLSFKHRFAIFLSFHSASRRVSATSGKHRCPRSSRRLAGSALPS